MENAGSQKMLIWRVRNEETYGIAVEVSVQTHDSFHMHTVHVHTHIFFLVLSSERIHEQ